MRVRVRLLCGAGGVWDNCVCGVELEGMHICGSTTSRYHIVYHSASQATVKFEHACMSETHLKEGD